MPAWPSPATIHSTVMPSSSSDGPIDVVETCSLIRRVALLGHHETVQPSGGRSLLVSDLGLCVGPDWYWMKDAGLSSGSFQRPQATASHSRPIEQ